MNMSEKERLARIEALLEAAVVQRAEDREAMLEDIREIKKDVAAIREDLDLETKTNEKLRNRGIGVLVGVGIAAGAIGASAERIIDKILGG